MALRNRGESAYQAFGRYEDLQEQNLNGAALFALMGVCLAVVGFLVNAGTLAGYLPVDTARIGLLTAFTGGTFTSIAVIHYVYSRIFKAAKSGVYKEEADEFMKKSDEDWKQYQTLRRDQRG